MKIMKIQRKQTVGKIQFIVESCFSKSNSVCAKDVLKKIMLDKANEVLRSANKFKPIAER